MNSPEPLASSTDRAACRSLLRTGSRSFFAASLFLPERYRDPATALYAFCRIADDTIDRDDAGDAGLADLRQRVAAAYAGNPRPSSLDRAFADVVAGFAIPRALPEGLIEGLAWDAAGRRYRTLDELCSYAARVAGTVGAMMSIIMGRAEPDVIARACDLGIAMQLTNIARDVGEDARASRLYLPLDWLRQAGIDPDAWLREPSFSEPIAVVVRRLVEAAEHFYARADAGISALPTLCQPGILAARLLYAEIAREVARKGFDSVSRRAIVSPTRKAAVLTRIPARLAARGMSGSVPAEAASNFIVEAVARSVRSAGALKAPTPWWDLSQRGVFVIDLFERLERRDRGADRRLRA